MARKITNQIVSAFLNNQSKSIGNSVSRDGQLLLHNNVIAEFRGDEIWATLAGWATPTTKERLNGLAIAVGAGRPFNTVKRVPHFNDQPIDSRQWVRLA
jgi:hypothetical protein